MTDVLDEPIEFSFKGTLRALFALEGRPVSLPPIGFFSLGRIEAKPTQESSMQSVNLTVDQRLANVAVSWADRAGNPAAVQNEQWSSDNPAVATVAPNGDGTFLIDTVDDGLAQITVSADADLGDGEKPVSAVLVVTVSAGQAAGATFANLVPVAKP